MAKQLMILLLFTCAIDGAWGFQDNTPQERLYLSLDKPYHAAGEKVAYSVFAIDRASHTLSPSSIVVYVDLIHPYGTKLLTHVLRISNGRGHGILHLPDTLSGGVYELIAYTSNTLAEDPPAISWKRITVDGAGKLRRPLEGMSFSFYPEGGNFIEGLENIVGIRLRSADAKGVMSTGVIRNAAGDTVTTFTTSENGNGSIRVKADRNSKLRGEVMVNGSLQITELPVAADEGYVLHADDASPDSLRLFIQSTPHYYGKKFTLRIVSRGVVNLETQAILNRAGLRIKIPNATILPGVGFVQILDEKKNLKANRAVFFDERNTLRTEVSNVEEIFSHRAKTVNLKLKDRNGSPVQGNFSVSVFENKYAPEQWQDIRQFLLFDAEVGNPGFSLAEIFANHSDRDNFLLSVSPGAQPIHKAEIPERFLNVINGVATDYNGKAMADSLIIVSIIDVYQEHPILLFGKTDTKGKFSITLPPVTGNFSIFLKIKNADELNQVVHYTLDHSRRPISQPEKKLSSNLFDVANASGYYKVAAENKVIENSYGVKAIKISEARTSSFSEFMFNKFDASYDMNEYVTLPTLRDIIIDILDGVTARKTKNGLKINVAPKDSYTGRFTAPFKESPLILLDGVPVFNTELLTEIPTSDIARIEVAHDHFFMGDVDIHGVFSVTTKNKKIFSKQDLNLVHETSVGFQADVNFEFPRYDGQSKITKGAPDFRSLLYYNPSVEVNAKGEASFNFSTSDGIGDYSIFVEGITTSGEVFTARQIFQVKEP